MQSNTIQQYALSSGQGTTGHSISSSAQVGDLNRSTDNGAPSSNISTAAVTLTVVNVNRNSLQLQVHGSQDKFSVPLANVQIDGPLNKGDVVLLTAVKNNIAKFVVVESANRTTTPSGNIFPAVTTPATLTRQLSSNWPQLNLTELNKIGLNPIYTEVISNSSQQSKIIDWLVKNAPDALINKSAILDVKNVVKQLSGNGLTLSIGRSLLKIALPLSNDWLSQVDTNAPTTIKLTAKAGASNQLQVFIDEIAFNDKKLTQNVTKQVNQNLVSQDRIALKKVFQQSFLTTTVSQRDQVNVVFQPDKKILSLIQGKNAQLASTSVEDLQITLTRPQKGDNASARLSVYVKPTTITTSAQNMLTTKWFGNVNPSKPSVNADISFQHSSNNAIDNGTQSTATLARAKERQEPFNRPTSDINEAHVNRSSQIHPGDNNQVRNRFEHTSHDQNDIKQVIADKLSRLTPSTDSTRQPLSKTIELLANAFQKSSLQSQRLLSDVMGAKLINAINTHQSLKNTSNGQISAMENKTAVNDISNAIDANAIKPQSLTRDENSARGYPSEILSRILLDQLSSMQSHAISQNVGNHIAKSDSIVEGLVNMLSLRLYAKMDTELKTALNTLPVLRRVFQNTANLNSTAQIKAVASELEKIDANNDLVKSLRDASARQRSNALRSAESRFQAQEVLYFSLPNFLYPQQKDIELRIRAINDEEEHKNENQGQRSWLIDMRLDIGNDGDILAKINLTGEIIKLNLYASDQALLRKTKKLLPKLVDKLSSMGLHVAERQCYYSKNTEPTMHRQHGQQTYGGFGSNELASNEVGSNGLASNEVASNEVAS